MFITFDSNIIHVVYENLLTWLVVFIVTELYQLMSGLHLHIGYNREMTMAEVLSIPCYTLWPQYTLQFIINIVWHRASKYTCPAIIFCLQTMCSVYFVIQASYNVTWQPTIALCIKTLLLPILYKPRVIVIHALNLEPCWSYIFSCKLWFSVYENTQDLM